MKLIVEYCCPFLRQIIIETATQLGPQIILNLCLVKHRLLFAQPDCSLSLSLSLSPDGQHQPVYKTLCFRAYCKRWITDKDQKLNVQNIPLKLIQITMWTANITSHEKCLLFYCLFQSLEPGILAEKER
jgi:hypothetical protein